MHVLGSRGLVFSHGMMWDDVFFSGSMDNFAKNLILLVMVTSIFHSVQSVDDDVGCGITFHKTCQPNLWGLRSGDILDTSNVANLMECMDLCNNLNNCRSFDYESENGFICKLLSSLRRSGCTQSRWIEHNVWVSNIIHR